MRGNHEDRQINNGFGFLEECQRRINEDPEEEGSLFNKVNDVFDWMPLAAVIEDKIICLHGGIGVMFIPFILFIIYFLLFRDKR